MFFFPFLLFFLSHFLPRCHLQVDFHPSILVILPFGSPRLVLANPHSGEGGVFSKKELAFSSPSFFSLFFVCLSCGVLFGDGGFRTTGKLRYTLSHTVASQFFKKSSHEIRRSRPQQFQKSLQYPGWTVKCNYPLLFLQKKLFKNVTFSSGKFSRFHSFLTLYRLINVLINSENNR